MITIISKYVLMQNPNRNYDSYIPCGDSLNRLGIVFVSLTLMGSSHKTEKKESQDRRKLKAPHKKSNTQNRSHFNIFFTIVIGTQIFWTVFVLCVRPAHSSCSFFSLVVFVLLIHCVFSSHSSCCMLCVYGVNIQHKVILFQPELFYWEHEYKNCTLLCMKRDANCLASTIPVGKRATNLKLKTEPTLCFWQFMTI